MAESSAVLIGPPDMLPVLRERIDQAGEVLSFADSEALRAIEAITQHRPRLVALERMFAATPRGAALIQRIKSDPSLAGCEIRVVAHDSEYARVSARPRVPEPAAPVATAQPLDQRGTRRAPRVKIRDGVDVLVDGNWARLIDCSIIGAQVIGPAVLKPNQRVPMALPEGNGTIRFVGVVAWARFEMAPGKDPQYRAGVEFLNADASRVEAFCVHHKV